MTADTNVFNSGLRFAPRPSLSGDGTTALLIVDMQYHAASAKHGFNLAMSKMAPESLDYFDERMENVTLPTIRKLLTFFRQHSLPVIYLKIGSDYRDYHDIPRPLRSWIRTVEERSEVSDIFWTKSPDNEIREEIYPLPSEIVIYKTTCNGFCKTNLEKVLRSQDISTLIITGVSTTCCVESTARDGFDRGFDCVIVDEGTADFDASAQEATIKSFSFNFGHVYKSADDVIEETRV